MNFKVVSEISEIETFARGLGVRIRAYLNQQHASGRRMRWRHCKGIATVEYANGEIWIVELHWFECHGIGRVDLVDKRRIRRIA